MPFEAMSARRASLSVFTRAFLRQLDGRVGGAVERYGVVLDDHHRGLPEDGANMFRITSFVHRHEAPSLEEASLVLGGDASREEDSPLGEEGGRMVGGDAG